MHQYAPDVHQLPSEVLRAIHAGDDVWLRTRRPGSDVQVELNAVDCGLNFESVRLVRPRCAERWADSELGWPTDCLNQRRLNQSLAQTTSMELASTKPWAT